MFTIEFLSSKDCSKRKQNFCQNIYSQELHHLMEDLSFPPTFYV